MSAPARASLKLFLADPQSLDAAALVPVFHRWIRESAVEGLLIDVADYRHVRNGPGVILVGHECDYRLDFEAGRPGLSYVEKRRANGSRSDRWTDRLGVLFHRALVGSRRLEQEETLGVRFGSDEARITLPDRLRAPNRATTRDALAGPVARFAEELYRPARVAVEWENRDPRHPFSLRVSAADAPPLEALIERLATEEVAR
jgi:hypothetical protein